MFFIQGITEILDSGRYKFITDGEHNTIALCIKKSRPEDEDDYKVIVTNKHGSDEAEMHLFVSGTFSCTSLLFVLFTFSSANSLK